MENKDITISINIEKGSIRFIKNSTIPGVRRFSTDENETPEEDNVRIELGIAKVFHKVLNLKVLYLIKANVGLFQKEDFELLGEMLSRILFGKGNNEMDPRNPIMQETEQALALDNEKSTKICRIYLEFDYNSGVAMLPWEYTLYKTRTTRPRASLYLSANSNCRFQLIRRVMRNPIRHMKAGMLFIVVVQSLNGNDATEPKIDPRMIESQKIGEFFHLLEKKHPESLVVAIPESVTYEKLNEEIKNIYLGWKDKYQVNPCYAVHYVGHSILENQIGKLVMDFDNTKTAEWLEDREFAALFSEDKLEIPQPSLVAFQSCDSAKIGSINNELRGIAYEMTQKNIPCVVGMQNEINLSTSLAFFETFYESILDGKDVAKAVTCGRDYLGKEFNVRIPYTNNSFGSPVLFITTEDPIQLLQPVSTETESLQVPMDANGNEKESVLRQYGTFADQQVHPQVSQEQRAANIEIQRPAANTGTKNPQLPIENETTGPNLP